MTCEVCWDLAYIRSRMTGRPQAECYRELLAENAGQPGHAPPESERVAEQQEHFDWWRAQQ